MHYFYLLFIVVLSLAVSSCARTEMDDLEQFVVQTKEKKDSKIKPLPEFVQVKMFSYGGDKVRDPFLPVVDVEVVSKRTHSGPRPDENRIKEPLENYSLDSMRMVGTLFQGGVDWVLIKDPEGILHRVQVGNYLGLNNGEIVSIEDTSIRISELIPDGSGWERRKSGMAMAEND